ncbi:MAG: hypothetical protein HQK55_16165 [Deltaproteobacteria bacterium]|nr:hypothetical protein [Deltaproteobacteria bacterium]
MRYWILIISLISLQIPAQVGAGEFLTIYQPPSLDTSLKNGLTGTRSPIELADSFLGIPYREDGTLDHRNRFTLFEKPDKIFTAPGLNCSGMVLSMSRYLLRVNFTIDQAQRDRLGDSGPNSPKGRSWDFGWDLILNLTEGAPRKIIFPQGPIDLPPQADAENLRGFDLLDEKAWRAVLKQIRPGYLYLASFSRGLSGQKGRLLHYHVAVILADGNGHVYMYQSTHNSGSSRMSLNSTPGLQRFIQAFGPLGVLDKKILIVETPLTRPTEIIPIHVLTGCHEATIVHPGYMP